MIMWGNTRITMKTAEWNSEWKWWTKCDCIIMIFFASGGSGHGPYYHLSNLSVFVNGFDCVMLFGEESYSLYFSYNHTTACWWEL